MTIILLCLGCWIGIEWSVSYPVHRRLLGSEGLTVILHCVGCWIGIEWPVSYPVHRRLLDRDRMALYRRLLDRDRPACILSCTS